MLRFSTAAIAFVVCVVGYIVWTNYSVNQEFREQGRKAVNQDGSDLAVNAERQIQANEVQIIFRQSDGKVIRSIAEKDDASRFVNITLAYLSSRQERINDQIDRDLDAVFDKAFASSNADIEEYADWFYDWGRSWVLLKEAMQGVTSEAMAMNFNPDQMSEAARHRVEAYLTRHFQEQVMKPEIRDPLIQQGVSQVIRDAHSELQFTIASLDARIQEFIVKETEYDEVVDPDEVASLQLDWDSAKWRAPVVDAEGYTAEVATTVGVVGFATLAIGPLVRRTVVVLMGEAIAESIVIAESTAAGAAVGTVEPGLGNLIGTAVGFLVGVGADYVINWNREAWGREDFVKDNREAVASVVQEWKAKISPKLQAAPETWFQDVSSAVVLDYINRGK